ncbi:MAG: hypothetical protein L3J33_04480 [Rhodobacteraceae bacterium]|nr:hypothetical protein [Paracoccaceae bacterium]
MKPEKEAALRKRLLEYPGTTEENVDMLLLDHEERDALKIFLVEEQGMSNMMAERILDMEGRPRPPSWHSVFFYPGGNMPRVGFIVVAILVIAGYLLFFN